MATATKPKKVKADLLVDAPGADLEFNLTPEQTVILFQAGWAGGTVQISLNTPTASGNGDSKVKENPAAYAE